MNNISLNDFIRARISLLLDNIAVIGKDESLRFSDLVELPSNMHGQRVVVYISNTVNFIRALISLDGAVKALCPISTLTDKEELVHLLSQSQFDAVVTDLNDEHLEVFASLNLRFFNVEDMSFFDENNLNYRKQNSTWFVPTSGTTSRPKLVRHEFVSLAASSLKSKKKNASTEVWGQFYDLTRYAGYQVLFNSLLNGHALVTSSSYEQIHERVSWCAENSVTHISATPSQWRKILMTGEDAIKIPLKQIVLGGEAADQPLLNALRKHFPKATITHTYASTEAGLGISVSDGMAGFPLRFLDDSAGSASISIRNEKLFLSTSSSAFGYSDGIELKDSQGWIDTGDLVKIDGERFFIIGRESGIINVGGDKVNPEYVRQILLTHPNIDQVSIYGKKNPITGMVLVADIQLKPNADKELEKKSIKVFVKDKFQSKDQPRIINIDDEILVSSTGKLGKNHEIRK